MLEQMNLMDLHGLSNISWEQFNRIYQRHQDALKPLLRGWTPREAWKDLGGVGYDELAIAATAYGLADHQARVKSMHRRTAANSDLTVRDFTAAMWNIGTSNQYLKDAIQGLRSPGPLTEDYAAAAEGYRSRAERELCLGVWEC